MSSKIRRKSRGPVVTADRRAKRSEMPAEAARLYLEAVAERNNIRAMALTDRDGLLVAGSGQGDKVVELGALGAACAHGHGKGHAAVEMFDAVAKGDDVYASHLSIGEETFCIASLGARVKSLKETTAALSRILSPVLQSARRLGTN